MPPIFRGIGGRRKVDLQTSRFIVRRSKSAPGEMALYQEFLNGQQPNELGVLPFLTEDGFEIQGTQYRVTINKATGLATVTMGSGSNRIDNPKIKDWLRGSETAFSHPLEFGLRCDYTGERTQGKVFGETVTRSLIWQTDSTNAAIKLMSQSAGAYKSTAAPWDVDPAFDTQELPVKQYIIGFILSGYYTSRALALTDEENDYRSRPTEMPADERRKHSIFRR